MSQKQAKQEKQRDNQKKSTRKHVIFKSNKELSLSDAKKDVFSLIQKGYNYRDIAQQHYLIDGTRSKRFSIAEISRIKKEFISQSDQTKSPNTNLDKSTIFKYLDQNVSLTDIVLKTNLDPLFIKSVYFEWLQLNKYSTTLIDDIYKIFQSFHHDVNNRKKLFDELRYALECYSVLKSLHYTCKICKKSVFLAPRKSTDWSWDLHDAMGYLSQNNHHHECGCKGPPCVWTRVPPASNL